MSTGGAAGADPVARALHAAWSGADPGATDPAHRPPPARTWPGPALELSRTPGPDLGAVLALALAADPGRTAGGVRLRRVPSAGGRYPVDVHVCANGRVWRYDPLGHALCAPARGIPDAGTTAGTTLVLSLTPARTLWRYGPRSLPVLLLDLGHAVGALLAAAAACGVRGSALIGPPAARLARSAALPWRAGAVRWPHATPEYPLAAVRLEGLDPGPESSAGTNRGPAPPCPEWEDAPPPPVAGPAANLAGAALTRLARGLPEALHLAPPRTERWEPAVVNRRHTASWEQVTAPGGPGNGSGPGPAAAATAWAGADRVLYLSPAEHPQAAAHLAPRTCGQPQAVRAARLLLLLGDPDPAAPTAAADHIRAGAAAHAAWLAATAQGRAVRPVGCWLEAVLVLSGGRRRLLHALALGP